MYILLVWLSYVGRPAAEVHRLKWESSRGTQYGLPVLAALPSEWLGLWLWWKLTASMVQSQESFMLGPSNLVLYTCLTEEFIRLPEESGFRRAHNADAACSESSSLCTGLSVAPLCCLSCFCVRSFCCSHSWQQREMRTIILHWKCLNHGVKKPCYLFT